MTEVKLLRVLGTDDWSRIVTGYTSHEKYALTYSETKLEINFTLNLVALDEPFSKRYELLDEVTHQEYQQMIDQQCSCGAYWHDLLVGIAIVKRENWNNTLHIQEFHVDPDYQSQGVGRLMMHWVTSLAKHRYPNIRAIVCETQNTNVPAMRFYRKMGFRIESVDLSFYSNDDYPDGEIALLMKHRLK